jgi:PhoD-like phosphatase
MIGQTSVRLRVDDWPNPSIWIRSTPAIRTPVETFALVPIGPPASATTWILDIEGLTAGTTYQLEIEGARAPGGTVTIRTPPAALETGALLLALLSCYYPSNEYAANPSQALKFLTESEIVPHLKIFCGDQIYGDVPASYESESATEVYSRRYRDVWASNRLGGLVSHGANAFMPEDHEFWNSFPDSMLYLTRSGDNEWFDWATAAANAAWVEQNVWNFGKEFSGGASSRRGWGQTKLAGVDVFVADTRTDRVSLNGKRCLLDTNGVHQTSSRPALMGSDQLQALTDWADHVERIGLLVLGQPLLARSTHWWNYDTTLADYPEHYEKIVTRLRTNIERRGASFIVLTGDIHWGRLVYWSPPAPPANRPNAKLVEFVASPIARVGGFKSLLSREYDVGKPAATDLKPEDWRLLERFLPGYNAYRVFATGENNFGILRLGSSGGDRREATFDLWNLTTLTKAKDDWHNRRECSLQSLEL